MTWSMSIWPQCTAPRAGIVSLVIYRRFSRMRSFATPSNVQRKKLEAAVLALKHADGTHMFRIKHSRNVVVCASTPPITQTFELSTRVPTWIDYFMDDATGEARAIIMRGESVFCKVLAGQVARLQQRPLQGSFWTRRGLSFARRIPIWPVKTLRCLALSTGLCTTVCISTPRSTAI